MGKFDGILLVSDLDATLLTNDKRISEGNRAAIDRFVAEGGRFTFITGRSPIGTSSVFAQYTPDALVGCLNGGAVYDARTKQYTWSLPLDPRAEVLVDYVIDRFPDIGVALNGFKEVWIQKNNPLTDVYRKLESLPYVEKTYREVADRMAKVLLIIEEEQIPALKQALAEHPLAEQFDFIQSTSVYYEILPKGAGKGALLLRIADMMGIPHDRTVAVGDNCNDVSMLRAAALGVAVANSTPEAKAAADLILTATNEENAVAQLIGLLETGAWFPRL